MKRDAENRLTKVLKEYATVGAGTNNVDIDTQNYGNVFGEIEIVLTVGTITATGTLDMKIQEKDDDDAGYSDVLLPDGTVAKITQLAAGDINNTYSISLRLDGPTMRKANLRAVIVGENANAEYGVHAILSDPVRTPIDRTAHTPLVLG